LAQLLSDTARNFFAPNNSDWQSILTNGTSFHFKGEKNQGIIYGTQGITDANFFSLYGQTGDYYFVETGNLLLKKGLIACPTLIEHRSLSIAHVHSHFTLYVFFLSYILFTAVLVT